jgi:uncharacterized protein (TIGR03437 family)
VRLDRFLSRFLRLLPLCLAAAALHAQVLVTLSTSSTTLQSNQSATLTALVTGTSNTAVTWSLSPSVGTLGSGAVGTGGISTNTYKAPALISSRQTVTITAASAADPTQVAAVQIQLQPIAVTVLVSPSSVTLSGGQTQQFSAAVTGISVTGVTWSISPQVGTIDANGGSYAAPLSITTSQKVTVTATSVFDSTVTGTATITLQPAAAVTVSISPTSVSLTDGQTQQFIATVTNATNTAVTWSISPQLGTMTSAGAYTAPSPINASANITVTATSVADPSKSATASIALSHLIGVGEGAPNTVIQSQFLSAFYRNGFNYLVSMPPLGTVKALGTTGYVQEFAALSGGGKLALATVSSTVALPTATDVDTVVQLWAGVYAYYTSVGATTAGYPLMDTQNCPFFQVGNTCTYDFFDKSYALFVYTAPLPAGQNFTISGGYYTEWAGLGGIAGGPGRPLTAPAAVTASTGTTANAQTFAFGIIYTITSGSNKNKVFGVEEPMYDLYLAQGGPSGSLGLPTSDVLVVAATGAHEQTFEGGALEFMPGGPPVVRQPVQSVILTGAPQGITDNLNLGDTLTLTAATLDPYNTVLTDRVVAWSTSNSRVIAIQVIGSTGETAVLTAVGTGTASVVASSEGVKSPTFNLAVTMACCTVGDGAPAAVQQAFQSALARNKISVQLPVAGAAVRAAGGYVQMVESSGANGAVYMVAEADQAGVAYVVGGAVLTRYQGLGGPAGALGYPTSDQSAGGTQQFQNSAALAGNPVRLVSGIVLSKWALLNYETGAAGAPLSEASTFSTLGANSGATQIFANGVIYGATAGPRAGQAYFVSGLILACYNGIGGAGGSFGMPVSDATVTGSLHQQNFEGGNITYSTGDAAAVAHPSPKAPPGVAITPTSIAAGGRAHLALVGFPNNSTIRVSVTGEPDFLVTTANGAYSWDMFIPLASKSGLVTVHAVDTGGTSAASGTLAIKGFDLASNRIAMAKVQGDNQTGAPGALLPLSLRIALLDSSGTPVVGAPVVFQASPGAQLTVASATTDSSGQAETYVRLPAAVGVSGVTANSPAIAQNLVTFYVQSAASTLPGFPQLQAAGSALLGNGTATIGQKGALLTAVASILRFRQNRGDLPSPNGLADPGALNQFLQAYCVAASTGNQLCDGFLSNPASGEQIVNLWRAAEFTGGVDVTAQTPTLAAIADLVAQGEPLLLSLGLSLNGTLVGGHFVGAIGIAADGSIVIQDPSPLFARTNLNDYLNGFTVGGGKWTAGLRGVVRFAVSSPGGTRFMVGALSQPDSLMQNFALQVNSAAGACGLPLDLLDAVDSAGSPPPAGPLISRIDVCDGSQPVYQIAVGAAQPYRAFVTDLAAGGSSMDLSGNAAATYQATRPLLALAVGPQDASFAASAVVNAATFTSGIAPGGIMAIFGAGLSAPGVPSGPATTVDMDGTGAPVIFASPFQINAQVPPGIAPGVHTLRVSSPYGGAQQSVSVSAVAPAIFQMGSSTAGAVLNQDFSMNGPANPLPRGQVLVVYATGLGAVARQGPLSVTVATVTAVVNGQELPAAFAGLAPGYVGLYQVNVPIPAATAPGLGVSLTLKEGGQVSNTVAVALQ